MGETPQSLPPIPHGAPDRARRRFLRPFLLALVLLAFACSVVCNVILYQRLNENYRTLNEVQLDPYGLKHPDFPGDPPAPASDADGPLPVVVFCGDSRARQWPAPRAAGWRFVNRGVGGQTTEQLRGRFDAHVASLSPRVVVVQGGVNDLKAIPLFPHRRDRIVADCKANLREIVSRARAGGATTVIVTTVFPTGPVPLERRAVWSPEIERAVEEVNDDLRRSATDGVLVLDAWKLLTHSGRLRADYAADTLHLTPRAYDVLNAELEKVLRSLPDASR
jgi:lysophospholipase L1-like esterase